MIEKCMLCGSKSGIIENNVCIVCKYKLSDYMKRQDAQIQQHKYNIQFASNSEEILKEWEQIDVIYQDMQDAYFDKGIDPISMTHPGSTLKELREECWGEIEKYKNKTFAATTQETPDIGLFCKYCGKPIDSDSKFCKFCGKQLSSDDTTSATAIPHQEVPQEVKKPLPETTPPQINFSSQPESTSPTPQYQPAFQKEERRKIGCFPVLIGVVFLTILFIMATSGGNPDDAVNQSTNTAPQSTTSSTSKDTVQHFSPFFSYFSGNTENIIRGKLAHPETAIFKHDSVRFKTDIAKMYDYGTVTYTNASGTQVSEPFECCLMSDKKSIYPLYIKIGNNVLRNDLDIINSLGIYTQAGEDQYSNISQGTCISEEPLYADWDEDAMLITYEEYTQIKEGMNYSEVTQIIGSYGTELSRVSMSGYETVIMAWDGIGDIGANANITFQGGKVIAKAHFGLK